MLHNLRTILRTISSCRLCGFEVGDPQYWRTKSCYGPKADAPKLDCPNISCFMDGKWCLTHAVPTLRALLSNMFYFRSRHDISSLTFICSGFVWNHFLNADPMSALCKALKRFFGPHRCLEFMVRGGQWLCCMLLAHKKIDMYLTCLYMRAKESYVSIFLGVHAYRMHNAQYHITIIIPQTLPEQIIICYKMLSTAMNSPGWIRSMVDIVSQLNYRKITTINPRCFLNC